MITAHQLSRKRALIECLKFLSASEILQTCSISRFWNSLCRSDELWLFLLGEEGNEYRLNLTPVPSLQEAYRLMRKFVYVIRGNNLLRCDVSTGKWTTKPLSMASLVGTKFVVTCATDTKLFVCGGSSATVDAFFVSAITGAVTLVQNMPVHRPFPGVCRYDQHLYCFAGDFSNHSKNCDRIGIAAGEWERLPDCIERRHAFNPVAVRPVIYLPSGCYPTIEVFDVASTTFSLLPIDTGQANSSANLYYDGELILLGLRKAFLWKPGDSAGRSVAFQRKLRTAWSSYDPVVHAGEAVLVWGYGDRWELAFVSLSTFQSKIVPIPAF